MDMLAAEVFKVLDAHEMERRHIARVLHDVLAQALGRVMLELELLEDTPQAESEAARVRASVRRRISDVLSDLERLARGLHPPALLELGLVSALRQYARDFEELHGVPVRLVAHDSVTRRKIPEAASIAAFRVVQEGLLNVALHARAGRVVLMLQGDRRLVVRVQDDGIEESADAAVADAGGGLLAVRGYVARLGGEVDLRYGRERGTVLTAHIPLENT